MSDLARTESQRAAAEYLRELLLKPGRYRDSWQCLATRPRDDVINQLAVTEVLANQVRLTPSSPGEAQMMSYQLRDVVSGALTGGQLSQHVLQRFVEAFEFSEHEAERLWRLWNGSAAIRVMSGSHAVPSQAEEDLKLAMGPRRHGTLSLHDHLWIGADGRIDRSRIIHVVEASASGVDRIPYVCDTNVLTLEVGRGCKDLTSEVRQIAKGVFATEILLSRSLDLGETTTFEYFVTYRYPGDFENPEERESRRAVMRQLNNLDMRVEFHQDRLPARLFWASWDGVEGEMVEREPLTLDVQHSAHRYLRTLEMTVAGFYWEW